MRHNLNRLASAVAILAFAVSLAAAQTAPTPSSTPTSPGTLGTQGAAPPMSAGPPKEKIVDGPVKKVDPLAKTVSVGWLLGLLSTTLEVTEDTRIAVEGGAGSLQDIQEGDLVKASYEAQDGKNIAKSIVVTDAEPRRGAGGPPRSPVTPNSPSMGSPQGSEAPSTGAPKTP